MKLPEEDQTSAIVADIPTSTTWMVDDIHVPGIGVRGALADDDPAKPNFHVRMRQQCARGKTLVSHSTFRILMNFRRAGSRSAKRLTQFGIAVKILLFWRPKLPVSLTNFASYRWRETQSHLVGYAWSPVTRIHIASTNALSLPSKTILPALGRTRYWLLRARRIARIQVRRVEKYRASLPEVPAALVRQLHWAQSIFGRFASRAKISLQAAVHHHPRFQISAGYKPDLTTLRRAIPPVGILLVMLIFMIQDIVMTVRR